MGFSMNDDDNIFNKLKSNDRKMSNVNEKSGLDLGGLGGEEGFEEINDTGFQDSPKGGDLFNDTAVKNLVDDSRHN